MKKNYLPILTLIVILMAANIACSLSSSLSSEATATPTHTVPISTQSAQSFEQSLSMPTIDAQAGTETIQFSEEQITSYVALQLQKDPKPIIREPQVFLENNQVVLQGQIVTDLITTSGTLAATVGVDQNGTPKVNIVSAQFGSFPIPTALLDAVSSMIDQAINDNINQTSGSGLKIAHISIADHLMTIVLNKK